jgi:hypothetical protein
MYLVSEEMKPNAEQIAQATHARSPVLNLASEEFHQYRGCAIALLLDGNEKGKVIASATLDLNNPRSHRREISRQVAESPYKNRRYQPRQVLDLDVTQE